MAYAVSPADIAVRKKVQTPQFDPPGQDKGVPREVKKPANAAAAEKGTRHLTNAIALYRRSLAAEQKTRGDKAQRMTVPTQLGLAWCLDQSGQKKQALTEYRKALNLAWNEEVTKGDGQGLGPDVCYSEEIIQYMLKLLDPIKDKEEVGELKKAAAKLQAMPRAVTPILIPMEANAAFDDLVDPNATVPFDLDGSGRLRQWGWITPKAAWLVFDPERGPITSALQLFGSVTFWIFWPDGYAPLAALDNDRDGFLRDTELRGLMLWQDRNRNGVSETEELIPVEDAGIEAIACSARKHESGFQWNPAGVIYRNGTSRPSYDWVVPAAR
jgi:hypothetical protein